MMHWLTRVTLMWLVATVAMGAVYWAYHDHQQRTVIATLARSAPIPNAAGEDGPLALFDGQAIPGVPVNGYLCPIAGRHHFIDSWGFPRSGGRTHKGQDMFGAIGTPLVAMVDGTISNMKVNRGLGGTTLWLTSARDGSAWYYAHLNGFAPGVHNGLFVKQGQVIAFLGKTGNARYTPPHLHIQYRPGGRGGRDVNNYSILRAACPRYK
ncbi:M23 family metallopeptidase [Stomatohabitans albus]